MLDNVSTDIDKREGSVIWDTLSPVAIELLTLYAEIDNIINESFADTASREYLIKIARKRFRAKRSEQCSNDRGSHSHKRRHFNRNEI